MTWPWRFDEPWFLLSAAALRNRLCGRPDRHFTSWGCPQPAGGGGGKLIYVRCGKVIDDIRGIAREHGYAVAVHGSLRRERDIDLIAAPWTKKAHAPRTLMRAVNKLPYLSRVVAHDNDPPKPHGRDGFVWLIKFRGKDCPAYVDLSVMPRA